jgi:hypothetical protein
VDPVDDDGVRCAAGAALLEPQDCRPRLTIHDRAATPHLRYARDDAPLPTWVATMAPQVLLIGLRQPHDGGRVPRSRGPVTRG